MNDQNYFKEKLYNHTMPVREGLWETIEAQLPPEKRERRFPLFWFLLFTSALIGGALMQGLIDNKGIVPATPDDTEIPALPGVAGGEPNISESTHSVSNDVSSSVSGTSLLSSTSIETKSSASKFSKNESQSGNTGNTSFSHNTNTNTSNTSQTDQNLTAISADYFSSRNTTLTSFLPLCDQSINVDEEDAFIDMLSLKPDPNCYKFSAEGRNYAISADFFAGPGFSPNSFEQNGGDSFNYHEARKATESKQYAWSAGARINLHLRSGLAARIGILYEQTGDIFDYTDTLATQSKTVVDSFFAADGTFLYADTNRVLIFGTLIKKIHNTYRRLDIPLLIGYEMPMGRSTLMLNIGPVINLTSSHKGQILDPMLHPRYITPGKPMAINAYKTSLGLSLYLSAGALFPLTDHISGLVEPRFLYRIKPVTVDSYSLKEHRHYAGLNLGIRYHFN